MNNYEKLRTKLCEIESIEKDIKELRFWCCAKYKDYKNCIIVWKWFLKWKIQIAYQWYNLSEKESIFQWNNQNCFSNVWVNKEELEIIWNKLDYNHLMMYFNIKKLQWLRIDLLCWRIFNMITDEDIVVLDYTKPFSEQEDKVYWDILNFLNK